MKLFWKLFCAMLSITVLSCSVGGFVLIDGQFRTAFDQEVQALYEENDMLRYALAQELDRRVVEGREELARLTGDITITTGGRTVAFRLTDSGGRLLGADDALGVEALPLTGALSENQRGWRLERISGSRALLHGASALTLLGEPIYLENCREVTSLFTLRADQYRSFFYFMLALVLCVGAVSFLVSLLILQPLGRLSAAARRMAAGQLRQRVAVTSNDELGLLSADFNLMAARLEKQVAQLTDAARRERDFTASFAHEVKTPLTSIIGYADLLLSRPATPEQVRESAGYIFREGRRLEALSLKLMELIVLDRQTFPFQRVSLRTFLSRVGATLRPVLEQAGLTFSVEAEDAAVSLEPDLMETVCLNLLDNARKATPPGGKITLSGKVEGDEWIIRVTDTGRGIPPEELRRITEPFYMVDKSRARAQGGAGLGLALCQRIAALHNGTLEFESVPGEGTTATVRLKGGEEL